MDAGRTVDAFSFVERMWQSLDMHSPTKSPRLPARPTGIRSVARGNASAFPRVARVSRGVTERTLNGLKMGS